MRRRNLRSTFNAPGVAAAFLIASAASVCNAGSICGTVRDGQSLQPVAHAAVFLFDPLDQYTGFYAGTDLSGHYCINNIPAGTYTLQVRVDDYVMAVARNVVVQTTTGVDVTTHPPLFLQQPWPNPATRDVVFRLVAPEGAPATLDVFDVQGRRVMGWKGDGPGEGRDIHWNLLDANGEPVASGVYLVRLRAGGQEIVRRFVRLR
jgi:Carboxypeptidase regulatory-like domain